MTMYLTTLTAFLGSVILWAVALPEGRVRPVSREEYREHCAAMKQPLTGSLRY